MADKDKKGTLNCCEGIKNQNSQSASCAFVSILLNNLCKRQVSRDFFFFIPTVHKAKENNYLTGYLWAQPMLIQLSCSR
ncbi:hypothetical protein EUGRSUZ_E02215 [Eucalyptus grandis]|uniref:Uncharacterized protein n=2 Tax=Eucalyptus grandis TaxID=71139 RepID=A0ACC3KXF2_EUCGR|nr:hypothetical protein EUGRSUZ_E02215 [Eucalyptus grandis]